MKLFWAIAAIYLGGILAGFSAAQPKDAERARSQSNRRTRAERKAESLAIAMPGAAAGPVQVTVSGTYVDAFGRKVTISFPVTLLIEEPVPPPPPPPPPPPTVPVISGVVNTFGVTTTQATSGTILVVKGEALPTSGILRLQVAGRIAPVSVYADTSITFTVPPGPPGTTTPITGNVELYAQVSGTWRLVCKGQSPFTILPG
jgi:hypothetical protein